MENIQNQNRFNHTHTHTIQRLNVAWYSINTQALNNTNFNSENRLHVCVKHKRLHVILFVPLAILTLQILRSGNNDQKKWHILFEICKYCTYSTAVKLQHQLQRSIQHFKYQFLFTHLSDAIEHPNNNKKIHRVFVTFFIQVITLNRYITLFECEQK